MTRTRKLPECVKNPAKAHERRKTEVASKSAGPIARSQAFNRQQPRVRFDH